MLYHSLGCFSQQIISPAVLGAEVFILGLFLVARSAWWDYCLRRGWWGLHPGQRHSILESCPEELSNESWGFTASHNWIPSWNARSGRCSVYPAVSKKPCKVILVSESTVPIQNPLLRSRALFHFGIDWCLESLSWGQVQGRCLLFHINFPKGISGSVSQTMCSYLLVKQGTDWHSGKHLGRSVGWFWTRYLICLLLCPQNWIRARLAVKPTTAKIIFPKHNSDLATC